MFLQQQVAGHNHVGIDGPEGNTQLFGECLPPLLGFANGILVANYEAGGNFVAEFREIVIRPDAQHKTNATAFKPGGYGPQALRKKVVGPQIGVGIIANDTDKNHHRLVQQVGSADSLFKRGIIHRPLRALHPVNHRTAFGVWCAAAPNRYPRILRQFFNRPHGCPRVP